MPSMVSRPEMGGATTRPTRAPLAPGDSSVKLTRNGGTLELLFAGGGLNIWPEEGRLACSGVCCLSKHCNSVRAGQR